MLFFNLKLIDNRLPLNTETILYYFRGLPYLWNKTGATVAISFSEQKKAPWLMLPAQKWTSEVLRCPNWSIRFHHFNYKSSQLLFQKPHFLLLISLLPEIILYSKSLQGFQFSGETSTKFVQKLRELNKDKSIKYNYEFLSKWEPKGTTQDHMGPFRTKWDQMGPYGSIWVHTGQYEYVSEFSFSIHRVSHATKNALHLSLESYGITQTARI